MSLLEQNLDKIDWNMLRCRLYLFDCFVCNYSQFLTENIIIFEVKLNIVDNYDNHKFEMDELFSEVLLIIKGIKN